MPTLLGELFSGPIDIVGDVHGEIDALRSLMKQLGYSENGEHSQDRRLIFLGDLCDRGPDSPAVIRLVQQLVERGVAQCLLGNHEINVLRGSPKNGNGWFFLHDHDCAQGRFKQSAPANALERQTINDFFASLPLTLSRDDLRLVHAAWLPEHIATIATHEGKGNAEFVYRHYEAITEARVTADGLKHVVEDEHRQYGELLQNPNAQIPLLPALGLYDETYQMSNPVRVLTSGVERRVATPFFASGKWRMVERVPWWHDYQEDVPVIVGHYWRWFDDATRVLISKGEADLFAEGAVNEWLGARNNVYCVDFSVGGRYKERDLGRSSPWGTRLAAVRWPEREVVFDEGERMQTR
jgi:Calcineurin-like phosphoesterase